MTDQHVDRKLGMKEVRKRRYEREERKNRGETARSALDEHDLGIGIQVREGREAARDGVADELRRAAGHRIGMQHSGNELSQKGIGYARRRRIRLKRRGLNVGRDLRHVVGATPPLEEPWK